jgi:hypothetical protein
MNLGREPDAGLMRLCGYVVALNPLAGERLPLAARFEMFRRRNS